MILESPLGYQLVTEGDQLMEGLLINDAYKAKMHNVYSSYLSGA